MAREGVEVATQRAHVHLQMRHRLGAVEKHWNAARMRQSDNFFDRNDRAQGIGNVGDRDDLSFVIEQAAIFVNDNLAVVVNRNDTELGTDLLAKDLPGHDVRVMFHRRDDDFIAGLKKTPAVTLRDQIDRFGGAAHKDDFFFGSGVEEPANLGARRFVGRSGLLAQEVHTAGNIGILRAVVTAHRIDYRLRLLTCRPVVQIDQRFAMYLLLENRKIGANSRHIESNLSHGFIVLLRKRFHQHVYHLPKRPTRYSSKRSRKDAILIRPTTSLANAKLSMLRDLSTSSPRES